VPQIEGPARSFLNANGRAKNIGFALHELATNAFKYGRDQVTSGGRVSQVTWRGPEDDGRNPYGLGLNGTALWCKPPERTGVFGPLLS